MPRKRKENLPDDPHLDPTRPLTFPKTYALFEALISLRVRVGVLADAAHSVSLQLSSAKIPPQLASYEPPADGVPIDDYQARADTMGIPRAFRFWVRGLDYYFRELRRCQGELKATRHLLHLASEETDSDKGAATDRLSVQISATLSRLGGAVGASLHADVSLQTLVDTRYSEQIREYRSPLQEWINTLRPIAYHQSSIRKPTGKSNKKPTSGPLSVPAYADLKRQFTVSSAKWKDLRCVGTLCASEEPAGKHESCVVGLRVLNGSKMYELVSEHGGAARDHFTDTTGRPSRSVIQRPQVRWAFYALRLDRPERQAAMARYGDLADAAWRITPARVRDASYAAPWLDPRAAQSPVASWTALLHTLAWMHGDDAGFIAPRWVMREGGIRSTIDTFFRKSMLRGSGVQDSYDSIMDDEWRHALEERGMTWPPRVFETALNIDLFLASVLAIDLIGRVFQIEGTETSMRSRANATGWTKAELVAAADIGPSTFDRILGTTKLTPRKRGGHGVKFSRVDVEEICAAARRHSTGKRTWLRAATNLESLLEGDAQN